MSKITALNILKIGLLMSIAVMMAIGFVVYHGSPSALTIFIVYVVFYVILPGMSILNLARIKFEHISTNVVMGLFTGWAFIVVEYIVFGLVPAEPVLYALGPILSILYLIKAHKAGNSLSGRRVRLSDMSVALMILAAITVLYSLLNTQYTYLSPDVASLSYLRTEKAWHLGIINTLSHGDFPAKCPWIAERVFQYHYFSQVLYSMPVRLFGLKADTVFLGCAPYLAAFVFTLGFYSFFKELTSRPERAGIYSLCLFLSTPFIARNIDSSYMLYRVMSNQNNDAYGVGCILVFVIVLKKWLKVRKTSIKEGIPYYCLLLALMMLLTGMKGPMGAVVIGAVIGTYLLGVILKRIDWRLILPVVILVAGFLLVYAEIIGLSGGGSNSREGTLITFGEIMGICFWKAPLVSLLKSWGIPVPVRYVVILAVFFALFFTAYLVPFVIGYIRELFLVITKKKDYDFAKITVYAIVLVGIMAMFLLDYRGHSQVYFGVPSAFLGSAVAYWLFEDLESRVNSSKASRNLLKVLQLIFVAILVLTSANLAHKCTLLMNEAHDYATEASSYGKYMLVTNDEYQALRWIDDNTPRDCVVATNRYHSVPLKSFTPRKSGKSMFFLYEGYSNRQFLLEGTGNSIHKDEWEKRQAAIVKTRKLLDVNNANRANDAREYGVSYIIVCKRFEKIGDLSNDEIELCYSNKDVDIYHVK